MAENRARSLVASITVFDDSGGLDVEGQRAHFARMGAAGVKPLVGSSGAGEGHTLSDAERCLLFEIAAQEVSGSVGFDVMGVEARTAEKMVELYEIAKPYGFEVMHVYGVELGHGKVANEDEVALFFRTVLDGIDSPCYVCNQPQMVGYSVPVSLVAQLAKEYPQVVGVQDTGNDIRYLAAVKDACGPSIELLTTTGQIMNLLAIGGHGYTSMEANVVPELSASVITAFAAGRYSDAFTAWEQIVRVFNVIAAGERAGGHSTEARLPHRTKAALRELGLPGGDVRPPRVGLASHVAAEIGRQMNELAISELQGA